MLSFITKTNMINENSLIVGIWNIHMPNILNKNSHFQWLSCNKSAKDH